MIVTGRSTAMPSGHGYGLNDCGGGLQVDIGRHCGKSSIEQRLPYLWTFHTVDIGPSSVGRVNVVVAGSTGAASCSGSGGGASTAASGIHAVFGSGPNEPGGLQPG